MNNPVAGSILVRPELPADAAAVARVITAAFGRADEAELVAQLRAQDQVVMALVAERDAQILGHVLFSRLAIDPGTAAQSAVAIDKPATGSSAPRAVALAPLAVAPAEQRRGVGTALVQAGLAACRAQGEELVLVLGDPNYYGRFGFTAEAAAHLETPYAGPHYQGLDLVPGALARARGRVCYAAAFGPAKAPPGRPA